MADLSMVVSKVDRSDREIGRLPRRRVFVERANFRTAHIFLFNSRGEVLLQRIAPGLRHAGHWGSSAAGYVGAGETYLQAARRKAKEELGIRVPLRRVGKTWMLDRGCRKFVELFTAIHDGPVRFNQADVSALEFIPFSALETQIRQRSRRFTPTFVHLHKFLLAAERD